MGLILLLTATTTIITKPNQQADAARLLALPPSTTGRVGAISQGSLERYAAVRASGARLVVVSGARTPTLLQRLPFIPAADAYVSENGGRIFYPAEVAKELGDELIASTARDEEEEEGDGGGEKQAGPATTTPLPVACPLVEDLAWRAQLQHVCGPASEEGKGVPPEERTGSLWAFYRRLKEGGWRVDAQGYSTAFRVQGRTAGDDEAAEAALRAVAASRPSGVACSTNLGVLDFYPARSGKEGAARRLERLFAAAAATTTVRTAFLCDDDNDLALASRVGRVFVPTFGSESMKAAVRAEQRRAAEARVPAHFVTPKEEELAGKSAAARCAAATEAMIEAAGAWLDGQEETCEAAAAATAKGGEAVVTAR